MTSGSPAPCPELQCQLLQVAGNPIQFEGSFPAGLAKKKNADAGCHQIRYPHTDRRWKRADFSERVSCRQQHVIKKKEKKTEYYAKRTPGGFGLNPQRKSEQRQRYAGHRDGKALMQGEFDFVIFFIFSR